MNLPAHAFSFRFSYYLPPEVSSNCFTCGPTCYRACCVRFYAVRLLQLLRRRRQMLQTTTLAMLAGERGTTNFSFFVDRTTPAQSTVAQSTVASSHHSGSQYSDGDVEEDRDFIDDAAAGVAGSQPTAAGAASVRPAGSTTYDLANRGRTPDGANAAGAVQPVQITRLGSATRSGSADSQAARRLLEGNTSSGRSIRGKPRAAGAAGAAVGLVEANTHL